MSALNVNADFYQFTVQCTCAWFSVRMLLYLSQ